MNIRWPWTRTRTTDRLVVAAGADRFAWARADAQGRVRGGGVERRGNDDAATFQRRLRALGLPARGACAVLPLADAMLLQIEAPAVRPEELKAAARWRIKDQVEGRLDDLTLDVMVVGADVPRPNRQLFVVAARQAVVQACADSARGAGLDLAVIDIAETAQRNLQTRLADAAGLDGRATAALVRHGAHALLTICADGELYHARRIDWDAPPAAAPAPAAEPAPAPELSFDDADFVDYGAQPDDAPAEPQEEMPRIVIELQRSFDLWERSWPDLPLAALWLQVGEGSIELAALLGRTLGHRVGLLDPAEVLPGLAEAVPDAAQRAELLPIVGALLRDAAPGA